MTLFEMNEKLATLGAQLSADADWIAEKAADPNVPLDEIKEKEAHRNEVQHRFDLMKAQRDAEEAKQRASVEQKAQTESDPKKKALEERGQFYRAVLTGESTKGYEGLGGIPAADPDLGNGSHLLPTTMANELITEPYLDNPMRELVRVSNIPGLEEPKLLFEIDGDAYNNVTDKDTANEIKLEGDTVAYGRNKVKVKARISDTVLHGSPYNLATEVDNALRSGLAANEMNRMFDEAPQGDYKLMSFYSPENNVKAVQGSTTQAAISKALADLPKQFRRSAKIIMSANDWYEMWGQNLNQSGMYFEDRPLKLFGKTVVLVDDAIKPVVGDFSYARINYDIAATYDRDKDVDKGVYLFVLTAWYDIKLRLKSAFRIAEVNP